MINGSNNLGIYAFHPGGAAVLFADGSTRFVDADVSADVVAAQLTIQAADQVVDR
jgi:prepilin-type processing-associated H-X9-DG protein